MYLNIIYAENAQPEVLINKFNMEKIALTIKDSLFRLFRRKTTSVDFIPEIDGLRFLAILLVVITHIQSQYLLRNFSPANLSWWAGVLKPLLNTAEIGVFLFFAISGFILMLPFARAHLLSSEKVPLKKYYLRRLTRLEPPYLLAMIFLFVMKIIVLKESFFYLLPHLGATLLYLHTLIYHEMSRITPITWSLEIEIQFYLLAPFLASIFRLSKSLRRCIIVITILTLPFLQYFYHIPQDTFLGTMQYFLVGFLLADLYVCQDKINISNGFIKPVGLMLLLFLIIVKPSNLLNTFLYPFMIFVFYCFVLNVKFWKDIFSNKLLTSIGGMCYSIYLLHFAIISFVGMKIFYLKASGSYFFNVFVQIIIQLPIVLLISSIYYLLIERPCMDPKWPHKVKEFILKERKRIPNVKT